MSGTLPAASPRLQPIDEALRSRGIVVFYTTWLRWIRTKGLPAKKVGGRFYIDQAELDQWIDAARVVPPPVPAAAPPGPVVMPAAAARGVLGSRRARHRRASSTAKQDARP